MSTRAGLGSALGATLILALLGALGCSGSEPDSASGTQGGVSAEVSACISGHPAAEPFDMGDVQGESAASLESVAAECRSGGGSGCDGSFISLEAARCIAQDDQFQSGLDEWSLALVYRNSYRRVVWEIQNVLVDNGPNDYSGRSLIIDAVEGRVLGRTGWQATQ